MNESLDYNDMTIENLGMSEKCVERWKRAGATTVGDILYILKHAEPNRIMINLNVYRCQEEALERLKAIGCLPDHLTFDE